jgi:hypothetical protein
MDRGDLDERLREVYEQNAPVVDETQFVSRLRRESGRRSALPAPMTRQRRGLVIAVVSLVVVAAAAVGAYEAMVRVGHDKSVVIITDDSMSPTGTGSSVSMAEGVYRMSYGQTANIDGLDITVTIRPTSVPFTESDPHPIRSFPTERDDWRLRSRLRSQYIITNTGSETQMVDLGRFLALGEDGNRYSLMAQTLELEPGGTLWGQLDFYVDNGVAADTVAYTTNYPTKDLAVWGPEAITEGPGYPVLQKLPPLQIEDVESIEVRKDDPTGGKPSVETYAPEAADLETFISYYEQTALVTSEGYPGYASPVQFIFHLVGGSDLTIGIGSPDEDQIVIEDTRGSTGSHPPSAVGTNSALVNAYYTGGESETETTTTSYVATPTDQSAATSTTATSPVQGPRLGWGEAAALEGRTVSVGKPREDPEAEGSRPGSTVFYSMVTIVNTGSRALTCVASEFSLEGNSSGSTGIAGPETTVGGHPVLDRVTLAPGESVTAAVRFQLSQGDSPVKVRLGTASSTEVVLASWQ